MNESTGNEAHGEVPQIALAAWKFEEVAVYIALTIFVLAVILLKMIYHRTPRLGTYVPESLILILVGLIFGAIVNYAPNITPGAAQFRLTPPFFFNILLPPIVLESAYSLYNKAFAEQFGSIMLFAVVGTVLNFLMIGGGLLAVDLTIGLGAPILNISIKEYLLFSSLIVAVDPVAVLAIFQDVGVDLGLYYLVFGESLLNDAVTVVLYNIMSAFVASEVITTTQILIGVGSFFTVSLGGALVGLIFGIISCLLTRIRISSEAILPLILSYLTYIVGDLFGWSGIIAMIVCGVFQAAYAFHNLSPMSVILVKTSIKQLASICEAIIFLLLGIEVLALQLEWHTGFIITAIVMCLVARTIVTFALTAIINYKRSHIKKIRWTEQLIISYGGLRGAVAFSLAILLQAQYLGQNGKTARDVFITATLVIILFTVGIMGMTMKPLVRLLNIRLASENKKQKLFETLNNSIINQTLLYVEQLADCEGFNRIRDIAVRWDNNYIRPFLQNDAFKHEEKIVELYEKMALDLHKEAIANRAAMDMPPATGTSDTESKPEKEPKKEHVKMRLRAASRYDSVFYDSDNDINEKVAFFPNRRTSQYERTHYIPSDVRDRLRLASIVQANNVNDFLPQYSTHKRAHNANYARFGREQAHLYSAMDQYVKTPPPRALSVGSLGADAERPKTPFGKFKPKKPTAKANPRMSMPPDAGRALLQKMHKSGHVLEDTQEVNEDSHL